MTEKQSKLEGVSTVVALVGAIPWFAALFMFVGNLGKWLKYGQWPMYKTSQMLSDLGIRYHEPSFLGVRKIVNLFENTSAVFGLIIIGFFTAFIFGMIIEVIDRHRYA